MTMHLTVGQLRRTLADLPDDAVVYYERIEDSYFKAGTGWTTLTLPDEEDSGGLDRNMIPAFTSFRRNDDNALYITAHY